jgi:nitrilase
VSGGFTPYIQTRIDTGHRYPVGNDNEWIQDHVAEYIDNSMVVGGPEWARLLAAAKTNNIYLSLAFSEKTNQTIYMALSIISNHGELLLHRQKVRPSGGERKIWSDGSIYDVKAIDTPYGRWGILECWEYVSNANAQPENELT